MKKKKKKKKTDRIKKSSGAGSKIKRPSAKEMKKIQDKMFLDWEKSP